ncbi:MAG: acyl-ACP--UDP-N-acetylglucosamine O-acyltransferase [Bacteroidales bacterium]|nr:acyl-ACP--UDP-N-acetylglucosamine O-acyltransferase [Bacteroidales bacterium]MBN2757754.1 acyl-ACP--UDP-N-acetylglucosamine O-acyltransferase [Bacteroidales bacterium]
MNQSLTYIHPDAKIGENVSIEPFVTIQKNVEIGEGTWIGPYVTIMEGARIGKNCKIFAGAVISSIPQDLKFIGEDTTVEIGDNTTIREYVTVNRGTKARGKTTIGNNCLLMTYAHIAHDCEIGNNVIIGNADQIAGEVVIDDFAILSASVLVHQFVHIGAHVMISGGSLVRKDVPPYIKAAKEPLSYVGINSIGLRRRNFENSTINEIQNIYRILFMKDLNNTAALLHISNEVSQSEERDLIINFIKNSSRGIMKGFTK